MNCVTTASSATSGLEETVAIEASTSLDFDSAETHQASSFVLLLDFLDHRDGQEFDFI